MGEKALSLVEPVQAPWISGLRAVVWIQGRHFFSRDDVRGYCWLWLLRADGRVQAIRMNVAQHGRADVAQDLGQRFGAHGDEFLAASEPNGPAWLLTSAPVVPLTRWAVSWGHPVQHDIRAFAAHLDAEVLNALGALEVSGQFFGSVENYNRLALLPETVRRHRLQALARFPALVAPLLLTLHDRPDMFGADEDELSAWGDSRPKPTRNVLEAMDRGRDLIGALAAHYGIDRSLVRSPLCRDVWPEGCIPPAMLQLLNAMPAHARPATHLDVDARDPELRALPVHIGQVADARRLGAMFNQGWNATWLAMEQAVPQSLEHALRDTRDFLRNVLEHLAPPPGLKTLDVESLGLAWLVRRGGVSLLRASRRWHEQALVQEPRVENPDADRLMPLFGTWTSQRGVARELLEPSALIEEGEAMHHCVGDYWETCRFNGARVVHLVDAHGAQATAMYFPFEQRDGGVKVVFTQLRGPCNQDVSDAMRGLAEELGTWLSGDELVEQWRVILQEAAVAMASHEITDDDDDKPIRNLRRLDLRSRREAQSALAWCASQSEFQDRADPLFQGAIAGLAYAEGPRLLPNLNAGDAVALVREPLNPHDNRAVRIDWQGHKLGYVPRACNAPIAQRMDAGETLDAKILAVRAGQGYWDAVEVEVMPPANAAVRELDE
ncbi:MAG TPA: HIRAN domain-containing protein [Chiayiivirga sp.]|nr:HIRAN domain-containing protein [Chiayiivirga sp.]